MSSKPGAKPGAKAATKSPAKKPGAAKPAAKGPAKKTGGAAKTGATGASKGKAAPADAATKKTPEEIDPGQTELFEKTIPMKELANVVLNDSEDAMKNAKKNPLVIDPAGQAEVFFRYRNVNNIDSLNKADMDPERLRKALIGGIRYGKPVAVTIETADLFDTVCERIEEIHKGLVDMILNTSILENEQFMCMVKEEDGSDFHVQNFNDSFTQHFRFIVLTKDEKPPQKLLNKFYVVRIEQK